LKLLASVEHVFWISGRGVVVLPVFLSELRAQAGDSVQLRSANGKIKDASIVSVESANQGSGRRRTAFILSREVANEDVEKGMEVWLKKD
jgi:translation elongation factor EF-Tu-like GTPase